MMYGNRSTSTLDGVEYRPGRKFRVVQSCTLDGMKPAGRSAFDGWRQRLEPGDIVTCTGFGPGWGGDPGHGVEFTSERAQAASASACMVRPSHGGIWAYRPVPGLLEPVEEA